MQPRDHFSQDLSPKRAAEIVGVTYRQLDHWTRTNLVPILLSKRSGGIGIPYEHLTDHLDPDGPYRHIANK